MDDLYIDCEDSCCATWIKKLSTGEEFTGNFVPAEFARQLERELNEARAALAAELAMPTHLLDVHAIADQRDCLRVINAELESAIRSFQTDFERIQWGWDGDCGSSRLAEDLFDSLAEKVREVVPVAWEPWTVEMVRNHKNFQETVELHNAEMERIANA
jgi:hypothetical protein